MPPYPYTSMRYLESGSGVVKVATDASGRVGEATMTQSTGQPRLDDATVYYALGVWRGPANSVREIPVHFVIR
jgi:TonB family protein